MKYTAALSEVIPKNQQTARIAKQIASTIKLVTRLRINSKIFTATSSRVLTRPSNAEPLIYIPLNQ
ncbi:PUtative phosphoglucosamine mutase (fragment) [Vibrio harveyi]